MHAPLQHNRTNWDLPDKEWLEHQHFELGKTYLQIATEVGCTKATIITWGQKLKIQPPVNVKPLKVGDGIGKGAARYHCVDRDWLWDQYVVQDRSLEQIAQAIGASRPTVQKWLVKHNISRRNRKERNERHSKRMSGEGNPAYAGGTSQNYHKRLALKLRGHVCEWCGRDDDPEVHHLDHDRLNGDPANLRVLCGHCNKLEAHLWNLEQMGFAAHKYDPGGHVLTIRFGDNRALSGAEGHRSAR